MGVRECTRKRDSSKPSSMRHLKRSLKEELHLVGLQRERNIYEGGYGTRRLSDCFVCSSDASYNTVRGVCFPLNGVSRPLEEEVVLERLLFVRGLA